MTSMASRPPRTTSTSTSTSYLDTCARTRSSPSRGARYCMSPYESPMLSQPSRPPSASRRRWPYSHAAASGSRRQKTTTPLRVPALPDELWLDILSYLNWDDLLRVRRVNWRLASLSLSPSLHRSLTLYHLPVPLPAFLTRTLRHVRHLSIHLSPLPVWSSRTTSSRVVATMLELLAAIPPDQLQSLSLPFSASQLDWDELAPLLVRIGGRLCKLDVRASGLTQTDWLLSLPSLRDVDLGANAISSLPPGWEEAWTSLERLSLAGCYFLPGDVLADTLASLPPTLRRVDLSELQQLTIDALHGLRVAHPSKLEAVTLVGIDHLTRSDVRALQRHWAAQRSPSDVFPLSPVASPESTTRAYLPSTPVPSDHGPGTWGIGGPPEFLFTPPPSPPLTPPVGTDTGYTTAPYVTPTPKPRPQHSLHQLPSPPADPHAITVVHTALLESDDEAGYRQFIGEVVGGTLGWDWPDDVCLYREENMDVLSQSWF